LPPPSPRGRRLTATVSLTTLDSIAAFAPEAGEVMTIVQIAMTAGLPHTALRDTILTHQTMAEGLGRLFRAVPARA
jgi:hypothetical protein